MFFGTYTPELDEKGRLFLPAKFREQLAEGRGDRGPGALPLRPGRIAEFANERRAGREAPVTTRAAREYGRMSWPASAEETPDKQGRITIPPQLREYAGLDRDVVVIGAHEPGRDLGRRAPGDDSEAEQEQLRGPRARRSSAGRRRPRGPHATAPAARTARTTTTAERSTRSRVRSPRSGWPPSPGQTHGPLVAPSPCPDGAGTRERARDLTLRRIRGRPPHSTCQPHPQHRAPPSGVEPMSVTPPRHRSPD